MPTLGIDRTTINKLLYDLHAHATQTHHTIIKLLPDLLQNAPVRCNLEQMPDATNLSQLQRKLQTNLMFCVLLEYINNILGCCLNVTVLHL